MYPGLIESHKAKSPGNAALQQQLDTWMEQWELSEKECHNAVAAASADEGWTVVTRQKVPYLVTGNCRPQLNI